MSDGTELFEWALDYNAAKFDPALSFAEVERISRSAWGYEAREDNWVGGPSRAVITPTQRAQLDPDSLWLFTHLIHAHAGRGGKPFKLSTTAMTEAYGWGNDRFHKARDMLVESGALIVVRPGRRGALGAPIVRLNSKFLNQERI